MSEKKSLIEKLHDIQDHHPDTHYLPEKDMIELSEQSCVAPSKVFGVATFYTMFSTKPRGKHIIRICENQTCHMAEAESVIEHLQQVLGIEIGETTQDGLFTLELSSCLGMCSVAPAMMIDEIPFGNLSNEKIDKIVHQLKGGVK